MDLQPTLSGPTVTLRPLRAEDFMRLHSAASDPEIWAVHPATDRWQEAQFRTYFDTWLMRGGGLAIKDNAGGQVIGASCYSIEGCLPTEVEIGWTFLARAYWGGATNREVKRLMIRHALESFERVVFRVAETNLRSRRALEKVGASITRFGQIEVGGGRTRDYVAYQIDRHAPIAQEGV